MQFLHRCCCPCHMVQALICRSHAVDAQVQSQILQNRIHSRQQIWGTDISSSISILPSEYNSTNAPYSFIMRKSGYTISPINVVDKQQTKKLRYFRNVLSWHVIPSFWTSASSLLSLSNHTQTHHTRQESSGRVIAPTKRPVPDNTQ